MKLDKEKVKLCIARAKLTKKELAARYGVSTARMFAILAKDEVTLICAGRLAAALGVDVSEIVKED